MIFLSYNTTDRSSVDQIQAYLRDKGFSTFLDHLSLTPGTSWFDNLQTNITNATAVIIFLSPNGIGVWQKREMALALDIQTRKEKIGSRFPVIPLILPETDLDKAPAFLLLNTYIDFRRGLDDPPARDLLAATLNGKPAPAPAASSAICPYRSLRVFREEDAPLFFGRETFSASLLQKVSSHSLTAVVGPSGSGKSSVILAGLLPKLRLQHYPDHTWDAISFTPGKDPFESLVIAVTRTTTDDIQRLNDAAALKSNLREGKISLKAVIDLALDKLSHPDRLLIIIDQFEEIFTLTPPDDTRQFLKLLLTDLDNLPIHVGITLRADYYSQAINAGRILSDKIQEGIVNLGPMTTEELRHAIEMPARAVGLRFEPGLVDRMLNEVEDQPGYLPLIEFALTELWKLREGDLLTHKQYDLLGEIAGAIAKQADDVFDTLSTEHQQLACNALARLVRVSVATEEGTDTRQREKWTEFDELTRSTLRKFVNARLLVISRNELTGQEYIEVAHEALIRNWPRLKDFLDKDRKFLRWRQDLQVRIADRQKPGSDKGALLSGSVLAEASQYLKERRYEFNSTEQEYIRESERAARKPRRVAMAAAIAGLILAIIGVFWWFYSKTNSYQIRSILDSGPALVSSSSLEPAATWLTAVAAEDRSADAFAQALAIHDIRLRSAVFASLAYTYFGLDRPGQEDSALLESEHAHRAIQTRIIAQSDVFLPEVLAVIGRSAQAQPMLNELGRGNLEEFFETVAKSGQIDLAQDMLELNRNARNPEEWSADRLHIVYGAMFTGQIDKALQITRAIEYPAYQMAGFTAIADSLFQTDPSKARKVLQEAIDTFFRKRGSLNLVSYPSQLALTLIDWADTGKANDLIDSVMQEFATIENLRRYNTRLNSGTFHYLFEALIKTRRTRDAYLLLQQIDTLDLQLIKSRDSTALTTMVSAAAGDIPKAMLLFERFPEFNAILQKLAIDKTNLDTLVTHLPDIRKLSDAEIRNEILVKLGKRMVQEDRQEAAADLIKQDLNDDDYSTVAGWLTKSYARHGDYYRAFTFAKSIPSSEGRLAAYTAILLDDIDRQHLGFLHKFHVLWSETDYLP